MDLISSGNCSSWALVSCRHMMSGSAPENQSKKPLRWAALRPFTFQESTRINQNLIYVDLNDTRWTVLIRPQTDLPQREYPVNPPPDRQGHLTCSHWTTHGSGPPDYIRWLAAVNQPVVTG